MHSIYLVFHLVSECAWVNQAQSYLLSSVLFNNNSMHYVCMHNMRGSNDTCTFVQAHGLLGSTCKYVIGTNKLEIYYRFYSPPQKNRN